MKKNRFLLSLLLCFASRCIFANQQQDTVAALPEDRYIESDIVSLDHKKGVTFKTEAGDIIFKPYILVQTACNVNYYDDEGLNLADQDNIANSGFSIPNAILGFSGKAFDIVTFNFVMNAAKSGANLLQQAWFDVNINDGVRLRAGKFKTPFLQAYQATLGETLFPMLPLSTTTTANIDMSLNAVNPTIGTGIDLGIQLHGIFNEKFQYQIGIFNGNGGSLTASKTMSDDHKWLPALLYATRIAYMPLGVMPSHQGSASEFDDTKLLFGLSANYNVEAEDESSNDFRTGFEASLLYKKLFLSGELYYLRMNWTDRMQLAKDFHQLGGYVQAGYFITPKLQGALRYDIYNRNGLNKDGYLNAPAAGLNYFFSKCNLKLQAMYQYVGKYGHDTQLDRDNDDSGIAIHTGMVMLQYTF